MRVLGNIIWAILIGFWYAAVYLVLGVVLCVTIIGIPAGIQLFKMAGLVFLPFGKEEVTNFGEHPILNVLWIIIFGLGFALSWALLGIVLFVTIIGIPFGKQCFKLATLSLIPFGATVEYIND